MSDLVERLRKDAHDRGMEGAWSPRSSDAMTAELLDEAADEIERLRVLAARPCWVCGVPTSEYCADFEAVMHERCNGYAWQQWHAANLARDIEIGDGILVLL